MQIQNGATLQYQGIWFGNGGSGDSIVGSVIADLARQGISVTASANNGGMNVVSGARFGINMTLVINNGTGFADEDAVANLIHQQVKVETGMLPDLDAIMSVNNPNQSVDNYGNTVPGGTSADTGASPIPGTPGTGGKPGDPTTGTGTGTPGSGKFNFIPDWLKNLFHLPSLNLTPLYIALLGLGLLIAVIFITSPRTITVSR